ncbi:MAG: hypothetical protein Q9210_004265 [Variospora velana]
MHRHHLLFSLFLLLTLAFPSFAILPIRGPFLNITKATGNVVLNINNVSPDFGLISDNRKYTVSFNKLNPLAPPQNITGNIAVIGSNVPFSVFNATGGFHILKTTEIACQCFKDAAGTKVLGSAFSGVISKQDPGLRLPLNETIHSVFCSDFEGLQTYFNQKGIEEKALKTAMGIPLPPYAFLDMLFSEEPTVSPQRVFVPLTNVTVPVFLTAIGVKLFSMMEKNETVVDAKGVVCQLFVEKERRLTVDGVTNERFPSKNEVLSASCVRK